MVVRFPIGDWRPAVEAAQRAGCSPAQVLAIVAEAKRRRGQWDEGKASGILRRRLFNAHPAGLVTDGWPSPHTGAQARQRAMAEASQRTAERVAEANQEAERAAARAKRAELEAAFGFELDVLPEEDLHELVRAVLGANQLAWAKWKEAPDISSEIFRGPVLRYLATREGVQHAAK